MKSYQKLVTVEKTSNLFLSDLPFEKGEQVEVIIISKNKNKDKSIVELKQLFKETQDLHQDNPLSEEEIQSEIDAVRQEECE